MSGERMNAAVLHRLGEAPRYEQFPAPAEDATHAVVAVTAAALKPADRWLAGGASVPAQYAALAKVPRVVGADGVGRLDDGTRVAFFGPEPPYGGMAERALVRRGLWFHVAGDVDDITAAAVLNPGMAAWKALVWEGELGAGQSVLVLGATGASGRIATHLARRHGAGRVVAAGRDQRLLDLLAEQAADVTIRVDCPRDELVAALAAEGPYDLVVDYLWGLPAEAFFAALTHADRPQGDARARIAYVLVGMSAGEVAGLPAIALRSAPLRLIGSGTSRQPGLDDAAAAFDDLLRQVRANEIAVDADPVPLAEVERAWARDEGGRRIVLVP